MKKELKEICENLYDKDFELLMAISTCKQYKKDEIILQSGNACNFLWFIQSGAVKAFENIKGNFKTINFYTENGFITNYYCWFTGKKSDITFKAVENTTVIEINYEKFQNLCKSNTVCESIGKKMAENIIVEEFHLRKLFLNSAASERYEFIEKNKPEIIQRFALKDIANFIGITEVSLSRIRKNRSL